MLCPGNSDHAGGALAATPLSFAVYNRPMDFDAMRLWEKPPARAGEVMHGAC
jgi:hypothetical protein